MDCLISVVIATFNRSYCIADAIDSVLVAFSGCKEGVEVIVADDCSTDTTEKSVKEKYQKHIDEGVISYCKLSSNKGVTGARNEGIKHAQGEWIVFLDSDDTLIAGVGRRMIKELQTYSDAPIVFFRCVDQNNNKVGTDFGQSSQVVNLKSYLQYGSRGECLVVVKKSLMLEVPFEESLRGYEGLTVARIMKHSGKAAILSSIIARRYIQVGDDRLSINAGFISRMNLIGKGHWLMAKEFYNDAPLKVIMLYVLKSFAYRVLYFKNKILN